MFDLNYCEMKQGIGFEEFRQYCRAVEQSLNCMEGYKAEYKVSKNALLREHDGEYLEIMHTKEDSHIRMNLCYSLAYQIPVFYFMVYREGCQPLKAEEIYEQFLAKTESELHPKNEAKGIYLSQNPISKEYFYTLHHCDLRLGLNYLVPFYLSLVGLHPPLLISQDNL